MLELASSTNPMVCLLEVSRDVQHFSELSSIDVKVKSMWLPVKHTSFEVWICVDSIILCPGVIDKEGADMVGVHSSQTITFRMMIASTHFFHGIKERVHVFILLDFKCPRDNRSLWRTGFFSYLDGVWEWVQVTCDHVAKHYTALAHAYAATKASS